VDAATDAVLDVQSLSAFTEGTYLVWDLKGRVRLRCTRLSGPNAVVAGLFLDPRLAPEDGLPVAPILNFSAPMVTEDAGQVKVAGENGDQVVLESSTNLLDWQPVSTNTLGSGGGLFSVPGRIGRPHQFYRTRSVSQPGYLVEASRDLVTWVPVSLELGTNVVDLTKRDTLVFSNRFYRVIALPGRTAPSE
jgi:hypothetical protein